jgi:hypothetical protein
MGTPYRRRPLHWQEALHPNLCNPNSPTDLITGLFGYESIGMYLGVFHSMVGIPSLF